MKRIKKYTAVSLAVVIMVGLLSTVFTVSGSSADIQDGSRLGPMEHYNGIIFNYYESYSGDMEGAMALGGSSKIGTSGQFDFGAGLYPGYPGMGHYTNPNNYPTLLMAKVPTSVGKTSVAAYGGPVVIKEGNKAAYNSGQKVTGTTLTAQDSLVDTWFQNAYNSAQQVSNALNSGNKNVAVNSVNQYWMNDSDRNRYYGDLSEHYATSLASAIENAGYVKDNGAPLTYEDVLIINFTTTNGRADLFYLQLPPNIGDYEMVVFNFPDATNVSMQYNSFTLGNSTVFATSTPGNALVEQYCPKIIWNFPVAESISLYACGVVGSVLAPNAKVNADGGSVNGMFIADELVLKNGFELHTFYMKYPPWDWNKQTKEYGDITLQKLDADTRGLLEGAEFELYQKGSDGDTLIGSYTTDRYGSITETLEYGDYYFKEVTPPEGYGVGDKDTYTFTIPYSGAGGILVAENTELTTEASFVKRSSKNNALVSGAKFSLYRSYPTTGGMLDMKLVESGITTNGGGAFSLTGLTEGYYYLVEYEPAEGYLLNEDAVYQLEVKNNTDGAPEVTAVSRLEFDLSEVDLSDPEAVAQNPNIGKQPLTPSNGIYTIYNDPEPEVLGGVSLQKVDGETGAALAGAEFTLYHREAGGQAEYGVYTTNMFGRLDITGVPLGEYRLVETKAPDGYKYEANAFNEIFTITKDKPHHSFVSQVENTRLSAGVSFVKLGEDTGATLEGAVFQLYRSAKSADGNSLRMALLGEYTSDENGVIELDGLVSGAYYLAEAQPPHGYARNEQVAWQILVAPNDASHPTALEVTVNMLTGLRDGLFADLENIANSGEGIGKAPLAPDGTYGMYPLYNQPATPGSLVIQKQAADTGYPLGGASFQLHKWDGQAYQPYLAEVTTNVLGYAEIDNLPFGQYKIVETAPPAGYTSANTIHMQTANGPVQTDTFIIDTDEQVQFTFVVKNEPITAQVDFIKVSAEDGEPLSGAAFWLYRVDLGRHDFELSFVQQLTSGANGGFQTMPLTAGTYYMLESEAPDGYQIPDWGLRLSIAASGSVELRRFALDSSKSYMENIEAAEADISGGVLLTPGNDGYTLENDPIPEPEKGSVTLYKYDIFNRELLAGARFVLQYQNESGWQQLSNPSEEDGCYVTDAMGKLEVDGLEQNTTYRFIEIQPPEGYLEAEPGHEDTLTFTVETDALVHTFRAANTPIPVVPMSASITLQKKSTDSGNSVLDGAAFLVYESLSNGTSDTVALRYREVVYSDEDGYITLENVDEGYYYMAETEALEGHRADILDIVQIEVEEVKAEDEVVYTPYLVPVGTESLTSLDEFFIAQNDGEKFELNSGVILNEPATTEIQVTKYGENGALLAGAVFELYHDYDVTAPAGEEEFYTFNAEPVQEGVTDEYGQLTFTGLTVEQGYYLREVTAPEGYIQPNDTEVYVRWAVPGEGGLTLSFENKKPVGISPPIGEAYQLKLKKVDDADGVIAGAGFTLYKSTLDTASNTLSFAPVSGEANTSVYTSDSEGYITIPFTEAGYYYLVETHIPQGYQANETIIQLLISRTGGGNALELTSAVRLLLPEGLDISDPGAVENSAEVGKEPLETEGEALLIPNEIEHKGSLDVIKKGEYGEVLAGAQFTLYRLAQSEQKWAAIGTYTTNAWGSFSVDDLAYGEYKLVETKPPVGYALAQDENEYKFEITKKTQTDTSGLEIQLVIENKQIRGSVTLEKKDDETGELLNGAEFALYLWNYEPTPAADTFGSAATLDLLDALPTYIGSETTENGKLYIGELAHGWYTLVETGAPNGYYLADNELLFYVGGDTLHHELTAYNELIRGDAYFRKLDPANRLPLDGASFVLYSVSEDGSTQPYNGEELIVSGELNYTNEGHNVQVEDGEIYLTGLPMGDYILEELQPLRGYSLGDVTSIRFTISPVMPISSVNGTVIFNKQQVLTTDITLRKVDADHTDWLLPGAKFLLYRMSDVYTDEQGATSGGDWEIARSTIVTVYDEEYRIEDLVEGSYKLVEIQSPVGYEQDAALEILFDIEEQNGVLVITAGTGSEGYFTGPGVITVENAPKDYLASGKLEKRDRDTGEPLGGARFALYSAPLDSTDPTALASYNLYSILYSNNDGEIIFPEMGEGYYYLEETLAPDGYVIDTDKGFGAGIYFFSLKVVNNELLLYIGDEVYDPQDPLELTLYNVREIEPIDITLRKVDADNPAWLLPGAEFQLYRQDTEGEWASYGAPITTEYGQQASLEALVEGSYKLVETAAPTGYEAQAVEVLFRVVAADRALIVVPGAGSAGYFTGNTEITVENTPIDYFVSGKIIKRDADTGMALGGAEFALYCAPLGEPESFSYHSALYSNEDGEIVFPELREGHYYMVETKAPENYVITTGGRFEFTLQVEDGEMVLYYNGSAINPNEDVDLSIHNTRIPDPASLTLRKVNGDGTLLPGAEFTLYKWANNTWREMAREIVTVYGEPFLLENLTEGDYKLEETKAPVGYQRSEIEILFAVEQQGSKLIVVPNAVSESYFNSAADTIEVVNTPIDHVLTGKIKKVDTDTGEGLGGAEFALYYAPEGRDPSVLGNYSLFSRLHSNEHGDIAFPELRAGHYYLVETKAPNGYTAVTKDGFFFSLVLENNELAVYQNGAELDPDADIKIHNAPEVQPVSLLLNKVDSEHGDWLLPGAEFQLYKWGGDDTWHAIGGAIVTRYGEQALIEALTEGRYKLVETQAPAGYELADTEILFSIEEQNRALVVIPDTSSADYFEGSQITVENTAKDYFTSGKLEKRDRYTGEPVGGAQFGLYYAAPDAAEYSFVDVLYSDADGEIQFPELRAGNYYLEELKPPEGYTNDTGGGRYEFALRLVGEDLVVDFNGQTYDPQNQLGLTIYNTPIAEPIDVTLRKVDAGDHAALLPGASFRLQRRNEQGRWATLASLTTEYGKELMLEQLTAGEYRLVETAAPVGYELADVQILFTIEDVKGTLVLTPSAESAAYFTGNIITVENEAIEYLATGKIKKLEAGTNIPVGGAQFALYYAPLDALGQYTQISTLHSNTDGDIVFPELGEGDYYLQELQAPEGYLITTGDRFDFALRVQDGSLVLLYEDKVWDPNAEIGLSIYNTRIPDPISLTLHKVDSADTDRLLPGAEFRLYKADDNGIWRAEGDKIITVYGQPYTIEGLTEGSYRLEETKAPTGYEQEAIEILFTIDNEEGQLVVKPASGSGSYFNGNELTVENTPENNLVTGKIKKLDRDTLEGLGGAAFALYWAPLDDARAYRLHSTLYSGVDGDIVFPELGEGHYRLEETKAPDGYVKTTRDDLFLFTLRMVDGAMVIEFDGSESRVSDMDELAIYNARIPDPIGLTLRKVDAAHTDWLLPGAGFRLQRQNDAGRWITERELVTEYGKELAIDGLTAGQYRLTETTAPAGYELPAEKTILFAVQEQNGSLTIVPGAGYEAMFNGTQLTVENTAVDYFASGKLQKLDRETGEPLAGAQFALYYAPTSADEADLDSYGYFATLYSNGEGEINFPELREGSYYIEETEAPEGYKLDTGDGRFFFTLRVKNGVLLASYGGKEYNPENPLELSIYNSKATESPQDPDPKDPDQEDPQPPETEVPDPPEDQGGTSPTDGPQKPADTTGSATGDTAAPLLYVLAAAVAALVLGALVCVKALGKKTKRR